MSTTGKINHVDDHETIDLIGGPMDGRTYQLHMTDPLPLVRIPAPMPPVFLDAEPTDTSPPESSLTVLDYQLVLDASGYPSRNDQGQLRYRYHP